MPNESVQDYQRKGYRIIGETGFGVEMNKPKRVSIVWLICTGVVPYLIYHLLFKREQHVFLPRAEEGREVA